MMKDWTPRFYMVRPGKGWTQGGEKTENGGERQFAATGLLFKNRRPGLRPASRVMRFNTPSPRRSEGQHDFWGIAVLTALRAKPLRQP